MPTQILKPFRVIRPLFNLSLFAVALSLSACVTVNVNFPESAVKSATDDYVRDLYRTKEKTPKATSTPGTSFLIDLFVPSASAEELKLDSASAMKIKKSLEGRVDSVKEHKRSGILGETSQGLLVIKDASKIQPIRKAQIEQLVKDENRDREALFNDTTQNKKIPLPQIKRNFAHSVQEVSPSGTWIQGEDGSWSQKK